MNTISELETQKLKSLGKVFDSIIKSQQIRIDNKKLEIKQMRNNIEDETLELEALKEALLSYKSQVQMFRTTVKHYENSAEELNKQIGEELKNVDYFG